MKIKEMVKLCSDICSLGISEELFDGGGSDSAVNREAELLVQSCNNVLDELYCDYAVKESLAEVYCLNGFIDLSSLPFNRVISLKDEYGRSAPYRYAQCGVATEKDGKYFLRYAETAKKVSLNDEITLPSPRITERIFSYGVLREYFRLVGDLFKSDFWDKLFYDALNAASIKQPTVSMPPVGRWT